MRTETIPRVERLAEAGANQHHTAVVSFVFGALLATAEIVLFDWSARKMAGGALLGTCVWGAVQYWARSDLVPRGTLQDAPAGIEVERGGIDLSSRSRLVVAAIVLVPLAWLADRLDVGAAFIPGQQWGWAAGSLVVLVRISRWERAHGRRVVYDPDAGSPRPYAGPPL